MPHKNARLASGGSVVVGYSMLSYNLKSIHNSYTYNSYHFWS